MFNQLIKIKKLVFKEERIEKIYIYMELSSLMCSITHVISNK
jgi:hypothetical protein